MDRTKLDMNMDPFLLNVTSKTSTSDLVLGREKEKVDVWSEELCLKLIKEFESRPVLWNPLNPFFYKRLMKLDAWQEVAQSLDTTPEVCKYKIAILMSSFRREKVKMMRFYHTAAKGKFKSKWYAFEPLSFMLTKKQRQSSDDDIAVTPSVHKYTRSGRTVKIEPSEETNIPEMVIKTEVKQESTCRSTTCEAEDEIKAFTNFVATKMRRYGANTRSIVQREIGDILYHADQNHYDDV